MTTPITEEVFKQCLPRQLRNNLTSDLLDNINNIIVNDEIRDSFRENLVSYTSVLNDGKFKIQDYINAVRYVSYKLLGNSNIDAYTKTFPDRFQRMVDEGKDSKFISAIVVGYNKNILVNKILEQTLVPSHVLNADLYQKAINVQAELMLNAKSEKVRSDSANSLLIHLKPPEATKIELDIGIKQDKTIDDLRATTMELVKQQKALIEQGNMSAQDIAHSKIIEGELDE